MNCRSVACIWSDSPPVHRVTAAAVHNSPPSLYTGGSNGSIIWWDLPATDSHQEIRPIAMLCGHAAAISDLAICFPALALGGEKGCDRCNVALNSNSVNYDALISACTDGVLCVWSRGSGHCRCRRKMPPWVGIPSMIQPLPENRRYVCVACSFIEPVQSLGHSSLESTERGEFLVDGERPHRKPSKCTVVIVDSYTLAIVQTVFHGNLSIGPLKFMAINSCVEATEKQSVLLADSFGKVQHVPILKESDPSGETLSGLQKSSSHLHMTEWEDDTSNVVQAVAFQGQLLAFIYRTYCIFKLVNSGSTIGEISFLDAQLANEGSTTQLHVISGMFLEKVDAGKAPYRVESLTIVEHFTAWNNRGSAAVYTISYSGNVFNFQLLSSISAVSHPPDVKLSILFVQLHCKFLRIESVCCHSEEPLLWKPHVTIWLIPHQHHECKMLAEGNFFDDSTFSSVPEVLGHDISPKSNGREVEVTSQQRFAPSLKYVDGAYLQDKDHGFYQKGRHVSSSMVIAETLYTPFAIVYGFYSGEIEVVHLNIFSAELDSDIGSPEQEVSSHVSNQYLLGHTGAVLCLASQRMLSIGNESCFSHVLVSGSRDCTIHIWDLDSSNLIKVMHQHVAPVRQIIFPPAGTDRPWRDCFLSVGEDCCVALVSLETMRVERMFPGHPYYPEKVLWDGKKGYLVCLCRKHAGISDSFDMLYIWDIKTGARERVLRGTAAHSMFDHFCATVRINSFSGSITSGNTSASSLIFPIIEDENLSQSHLKAMGRGVASSNISTIATNTTELYNNEVRFSKERTSKQSPPVFSLSGNYKHPVKSSCPFPGVATLSFDLSMLMSLSLPHEYTRASPDVQDKTCGKELESDTTKDGGPKMEKTPVRGQRVEVPNPHHLNTDGFSGSIEKSNDSMENYDWIKSPEGCLLRFSLSFLHFWNVDSELDSLLITEMKLKRPQDFNVASGLLGDRGSFTLTFPGSTAVLELWKLSSEFCAIRSLTIVSLAQHMVSLSHSCTAASSALAAFYTRTFAEIIPDIRPPLLQLLVSFWQDECEHVRMAARSLFHCAASRAIPLPLRSHKAKDNGQLLGSFNGIVKSEQTRSSLEEMSICISKLEKQLEIDGHSQTGESEIMLWLESYEMQDWISCVGGTSQDAMTSHIIVAAALAIWYPSLVNSNVVSLVVHPLVKLVMAVNEHYSSTAAEILAEGMESTWKACIYSEIPRLIGDVFFQIECVSGASTSSSGRNPVPSLKIQDNLIEILLPSLAMADIAAFLHVIESQVWSTASDSSVHVVSLKTLIRVVRGCPRNLAQYLDKAVTFILQTMDQGNSVMRRTCLQTSRTALKEVIRVFPMVALNISSTRLALGDAIGEINSSCIRVYDMQSMAKIKILDASGPPGLPNLLGGAAEVGITTAISALSFSPDGEGLVAFSEHGLMIRWWSLGSVWWEKLTRNLAPVQCTKLIFVPPWDGFSPNSTRSSIMASVMGDEKQSNSQENSRDLSQMERMKSLLHNLDLSYRLQWVGDRKVQLTGHGRELGTFQL